MAASLVLLIMKVARGRR